MPIWKFTGDSPSETLELIDIRLDLNAYHQSIENILLYLRAHDGEEFGDIIAYLIAAGYSVEDVTLALDTSYEYLENAGVDLSTLGHDYKDAKTWLSSYLQALDSNAPTDLSVVATAYEHLATMISVVATGYQHLNAYLAVLGLSITDFPVYINAAGYHSGINLRTYLSAGSATVLTDMKVMFWVSNGLDTDKNLGLTLIAIKQLTSPYAGIYQRVSSVVRRLS